MERLIGDAVRRDLQKKMVLLSGPRQVGKTWLARELARTYEKPVYLNWDNGQDREVIKRQAWPGDANLIVLDEIHKMPGWKTFLKGVYDTRRENASVLVTGSARLETFSRSGDSLVGRYYHHRLLPVSPAEARLAGKERPLDHFLERGGFPEPFLATNDDDPRRWRRFYLDGLIREDILDFENIRRLRSMNLLIELLRRRVASPLSYQSLSEDIDASPNTVRHYIEVLEALYIVFPVYPHHRSIARALRQQPKIYFYDTGLVEGDRGVRLENHVAVSLLADLSRRTDTDGVERELRYLRTKEGKEVDFLVTRDRVPHTMIEVKWQERSTAVSLRYFYERYGFPAFQLVGDLRLEDHGAIPVVSCNDWLAALDRHDW